MRRAALSALLLLGLVAVWQGVASLHSVDDLTLASPAETLRALRDDRALLVDGRWHLATKETGGEVPLADFSIVVLFADEAAERPDRMAVFFDREQALELAAGDPG